MHYDSASAVPLLEEREEGENPHRVPACAETRGDRAWEWGIRALGLLAVLYGAFYLRWRWTETLNPEALWFSLPLAAAESWMWIGLCLTLYVTWRLPTRIPPPAPEGLSVDVFVTTYNEPLEVVRRTALAAREIRYPHRTWILDDGRRREMRELARSLGIGYLRRSDNRHAKAGNLNRALKKTRGDFILQLDADHVPLPHILDRLLGFFQDERVAFVQTPQDFYNTDSFTYRVDERTRSQFEEQRYFFSIVQRGKDRFNAAFFCGSCGVIRRSALEEIGGFATETITEDMETSLLLHARGWQSVYYAESLAYGLAPGSAEAFHVQRLRWGQGAMQIFRKYNPLTLPGLTLSQRVNYLASMLVYVDGLFCLVLYLAPILFFLTGIFPLQVEQTEFLLYFLPFLGLMLLATEALARGATSVIYAARYSMARFYTYIRTLWGLFARKRLAFQVTPKGESGISTQSCRPHLVLMALSALSVVWAAVAAERGWIDYGAAGWGSLAWWINYLWLLINFALALDVVRLTLRSRERRNEYRFPERLPVYLDQGGEQWVASTENLTSSGLALRSSRALNPGGLVTVHLLLGESSLELQAEVLERSAEGPWPLYRLRFRNMDLPSQVAIDLHCSHHVVPEQALRFRSDAAIAQKVADWLLDARRTPRVPLRVLARLHFPDSEREESAWAMVEDMNSQGVGLLSRNPLSPGMALHLEAPDAGLSVQGTVVFSRPLETPAGIRYSVGVQHQGVRLAPPVHSAENPWILRIERWLISTGGTAPAEVALSSERPLVAEVP